MYFRGRWLICLLCGWVLGLPALAGAQDAATKLAQRQREQAEILEKITAVQKEIDAKEGARKEASDALKASELAISVSSRKLNELDAQQKRAQTDLDDLNVQIAKQQGLLNQNRRLLSEQLRQQYQSGLSPLSAWLSGIDPQLLGRNLAYLDYVAKARTAVVARVQGVLAELIALQRRADEKQREIAGLVQQEKDQKASLDKQRKERTTLLAQIEGQLLAQRAQADKLDRDEKHLTELISSLDEQIAMSLRLAEANRREQEAQAQARAEAQADAKRREQEVLAKRRAQEAEQADAARQQAVIDKKNADSSQQTTQEGLKAGLKWPVRGRVMARFGTDRPEGGVWRGLLIAAAEGAPVQVIANGTVVYATWLRGFGNIMIIDHGQQSLSIYAYLQSMLKQIGDVVVTGDTIATVGNTGGQLDSALYFEIRRRNVAVDPILFLTK